MASSIHPTLTIPAAYLEDARTAITREIEIDADVLRDQQVEAIRSPKSASVDSSAEILRRDLALLDEMLGVTDDVTVTAPHDGCSSPITNMLQAMSRVVAKRLRDEAQYSPLDMGAVLEISERLAWCAREAIQIEPRLARGDDYPKVA
jgi:hypothetical protein